MADFFKKIMDDLVKMKNLPVALLAFLLALLEPINKMIKLFNDLPLIVILGGIYVAVVILYLYIQSAKTKDEQQVEKERYTVRQKKGMRVFFILATAGLLTYTGLWISQLAAHSKQERLKTEAKKKNDAERYKKINILAAAFSQHSNDHFAQQLTFILQEKLDSLKNEVYIDRDTGYYGGIPDAEKRINSIFDMQGVPVKGIFAYGDYAPEEKNLVCRISVHNFGQDCINVQIPGASGTDCLLGFEQDYQIDFGKKIESTADFILALLLQRLGRYDQSQAVLSKYQPTDTALTASMKVNFLKLAGNNSMAVEKFPEAIAFYNAAQEIEPHNDQLKYTRAVAYASNNELYTAKTLITETPATSTEKTKLIKTIDAGISNPAIRKNGFVPDASGAYELKVNDNPVAEKVDYLDEVSINNKRYFIPGAEGNYSLVDEKGNNVQAIDGKSAELIIKERLRDKNKIGSFRSVTKPENIRFMRSNQ